MRVPAGEEKAAEQVLRVRALEAGHRLHALKDGAARVELHLLLREVADLHAVPERTGLAFDEPLEQRRLARAVRANERDVLPALDGERRVVQEDALADRDLDPVRLDDSSAAARRLEELEAEPSGLA